jgi:alpha-L-fucosidase
MAEQSKKISLYEVVQAILADGVIEDSELEDLKKRLQANGTVSKEEGDAILGLMKWQVFIAKQQSDKLVSASKQMTSLLVSMMKPEDAKKVDTNF